jgi:hypothetical protein
MKNSINDLRNHMFAALERLNNEELTKEELDQEINRAQAISEVGKVIVDSAKTEAMYLKMQKKHIEIKPSGFVDEEEAKSFIDRPKPEYSNNGYLSLQEKYEETA